MTIAPYQVEVLALGGAHEESGQVAGELYRDLGDRGLEVILDDRDERPGPKFKDADLVGIPLRVVVGERGLKDGEVEVSWREDRRPDRISVDDVGEEVAGRVQKRLEELAPERWESQQDPEGM